MIPERKFWQVRLSTAVALMLMAGILLGLDINSAGWPVPCVYHDSGNRLDFDYAILFADAFVHLAILILVAVVAGIWMSAAEGERQGSER